jgi:hypothetical protein
VLPVIPVDPEPLGVVTVIVQDAGATPVLSKMIVQSAGEEKFKVNVMVPPAAQL